VKYIVVQFDYPNRKGMYEKLLKVFEQSVKENDPENEVIVKRVSYPQIKTKACFSSNTHKLAIWVSEMEKLQEGDELCFIDCDMMVLKSPNDVFQKDFDIAYTERPKSRKDTRLPVNGGVVFCRNNERSRQFMKRWKEVNDKMFRNPGFHQIWRKKYAGMNQSAFGYLLEHPKEYKAKLFPVPCNTYNVCNESWHKVGVDKNIRIVHIKSDLRRMCLEGVCRKPAIKQTIQIWLDLLVRAGGDKITLSVSALNKPTRRKRAPIPMNSKNKNKGHKSKRPIDFGVQEDETVHKLSGRQIKRRLFTP